MGQVTDLLRRVGDGDKGALESLLPLVYGELRALAARHLRGERSGHTLTPTALVHEAFLSLAGPRQIDLRDSRHFFAVASKAMRFILVDYARRRRALKRGGGGIVVTFAAGAIQQTANADKILEIDLALTKLANEHERQASVVELLFFGGLTQRQTATVLGVSLATIQRDWRFARAWLSRELHVA